MQNTNQYYPPITAVRTDECFGCGEPRHNGGGLVWSNTNVWQCDNCIAYAPAVKANQYGRKPEAVESYV